MCLCDALARREYLIRYRVLRAKELLRMTDYSIARWPRALASIRPPISATFFTARSAARRGLSARELRRRTLPTPLLGSSHITPRFFMIGVPAPQSFVLPSNA